MTATAKKLKVTDTTENLIVTSPELTPKKSTEIADKKNVEITNDGRTILKTAKPLDPIDPPKIIDMTKSSTSRDFFSRIDEVLEIAKRVEKSVPDNFEVVFEAAMKIYIMTTFRSANNMAIEVQA